MALECELKYLDVDIKSLSERLKDAGGECMGRYFESNLVFDYPDRSLKSKGILLRLREKQGKAVLTVKKPPQEVEPSMLKVFEEIETGVNDCNAMESALQAVGFIEAFGYEKVREKWRFMECVVCLDTLPFGDFAEVEGNEKTVSACAYELGLDAYETTKATYHGLNIEYRHANSLPPDENFRFTEAERDELKRQLGKDWPPALDSQ